jgi:hypothetical protein
MEEKLLIIYSLEICKAISPLSSSLLPVFCCHQHGFAFFAESQCLKRFQEFCDKYFISDIRIPRKQQLILPRQAKEGFKDCVGIYKTERLREYCQQRTVFAKSLYVL